VSLDLDKLGMLKVVRRVFIGLCLAIFAICTAMLIWIDSSYFRNLPHTPHPNAGRVIRIVVSHGSVRYGTPLEVDRFNLLVFWAPVAGIIFCVGVGTGLLFGDLRLKGSRDLKAQDEKGQWRHGP
jgi:hypothetical protein